uniref:Uncharacterized protein n=1 Tax=Anguilla anguilla TaxID=7936 RepID=A0A0E9RV76_ANGAN
MGKQVTSKSADLKWSDRIMS